MVGKRALNSDTIATMSTVITAQDIVARIGKKVAAPKPERSADGFAAGDPSTPITGIATTFVPTLDVLHRAAAANKNLIVTRESPYWSRNPRQLAHDATFALKQEFITSHKLVIYRLRESRDARTPDAQLAGLAKALGWDGHKSDGIYFQIPQVSLQALSKQIAAKMKLNAVRVIGGPQTKIAKVALTHGMITTPELARVLKEPAVDAVVIGESVEWEASTYFQDVIASGQAKGLIVLGLAASEEPGSEEMASWLKSFITEIPVECIRAGDPFAAGRWA
jgi:putative NIF3 family GTP cyclohydrolase 1 type 2